MMNRKRYLGIFTAIVVVLVLFGCRRGAGDSQAHLRDSTAVTAGDTAQMLPPNLSLLSYEQREGRGLFLKYCSVCHGDQGKGDGFNAFNLDPKPRNLADDKYMHTLADDRIAQTIREGGRGVNRSSLMPSWGGRLTKNDILYLVAFVRTLPSDTAAASR